MSKALRRHRIKTDQSKDELLYQYTADEKNLEVPPANSSITAYHPSTQHGGTVKRAVGYCRVSTAIQADQGVSLEMQRAKIEDYCKLYDLNLEAVHIEEGISGKSIAGRPGMVAILEAVKSKQLDAVVAYKLDRIARNAREALEIAELLQKHNVQLHCVSEKIDTGSANGKLFYTLLSAMAEW